MKSWLSSNLPDRESLLARRWMKPFAHRLTHPSLWHLNRWSVSRGLALGLFLAFVIPVGQIVLAAALALTVRANLLVAAAATLVSNPFTFPAIYFAAYRFGQGMLATDASPMAQSSGGFGWLLEVSAPVALGLLTFATLSAFAGYAGVQLAWRIWIGRRWLRRRSTMPRSLSGARHRHV